MNSRSQSSMAAWDNPVKRANILAGQRKARLGTPLHSRYFTLERHGIHQKEKKQEEESLYTESRVCIDGHALDIAKMIDALDVPEEFLLVSKRESNLHKIIRLWLTTKLENADFEFSYELKMRKFYLNPIDIVVSDNNGGSTAAYEIETMEKDMRSMLVQLLMKRRFYENLTVVVPKCVFCVKYHTAKMKHLHEFLKDYGINFIISPFSYSEDDFSTNIYERVSFS